MRLRSSALVLSVLALVQLAAGEAVGSSPARGGGRDGSKDGQGTSATAAAASDAPAKAIGKKDAPVDGKDGRPHQGPFVETEAERDRKKAKESGDGPALTPGKKPGLKGSSGEAAAYDEGFEKDIPVTNDGVMDDPHRKGPKEGTRGTEGGISEKSRGKTGSSEGSGSEKTPEEPKEAPPLPHSEQQKLAGKKDEVKPAPKVDTTIEKPRGKLEEVEVGGLSKPEDLPDKPHNVPIPRPDGSASDNHLEIKKSSKPLGTNMVPDPNSLIQPFHSFILSFTMIIFSEIGDKTFLVAALMAMKHPAPLVLSSAFSALAVMTVLSALLGHALPTLLPVRLTSFMAALLFLIFGLKMLREGLSMSPSEGVSAEMREVEMELEEKEQLARKMGRRRSSLTPYALEAARTGSRGGASRLPAPPASPPSSPDDSRSPSPSRRSGMRNTLSGVYNLFSLLFSPAWVQTFVMTFLGEWGDRSQIATIAMSAGQDYAWVSAGALVGHCLCTAVAVVGGRAIAGKVSLRVVTLGGAVAFLFFGVIYLVEALYYK